MGYSTFVDVENKDIRDRNRGSVMLNIFEDHATDGVMNAMGMATVLGYFREIPEGERGDALAMFTAMCESAGYLGNNETRH